MDLLVHSGCWNYLTSGCGRVAELDKCGYAQVAADINGGRQRLFASETTMLTGDVFVDEVKKRESVNDDGRK